MSNHWPSTHSTITCRGRAYRDSSVSVLALMMDQRVPGGSDATSGSTSSSVMRGRVRQERHSASSTSPIWMLGCRRTSNEFLGDQLPDEVVLHVPPHPLDDGDDGDEEHHADAHAQQREEALQLLGADLGQRQSDGFKQRHGGPPTPGVRRQFRVPRPCPRRGGRESPAPAKAGIGTPSSTRCPPAAARAAVTGTASTVASGPRTPATPAPGPAAGPRSRPHARPPSAAGPIRPAGRWRPRARRTPSGGAGRSRAAGAGRPPGAGPRRDR